MAHRKRSGYAGERTRTKRDPGTPAPSESPAAPVAGPPAEAEAGRTPADERIQRALDELHLHSEHGRVPTMAAAEYAAFRASIERDSIRVPIEITAAGVVLDGRERLRAARELAIERVPVRVVAPADELEYMLLAAIERRQLTASQRAALAVELDHYRQLCEQATARQRQNLHQNAEVAKSPPRGKTRDLAAAWAGVSARTLQEAATTRELAPELFEQVKAGTLAADVAARRARRAQRDANPSLTPPLPGGAFQVVYADPPWQMGHPDGPYAPENYYPTMPLDEIKALAVPAADDAVLFLWAVNSLLPEALEVIAAWGFRYRTNFAWVKPMPALGRWHRSRHELFLLATKGDFPAPDPEDCPESVLEAPRGRHSAKPIAAYQLIEAMYPQLSRLELFARGKARPGWTIWGNEAEQA